MDATSKKSPLRKAAILVSILDSADADALLDQMGTAQAAKVRAAVMDLDDVSEQEQRQVLAEFLGRKNPPVGGTLRGPSESSRKVDGTRRVPATISPGADDVELMLSDSAAQVAADTEATHTEQMPRRTATTSASATTPAPSAQPFAFLAETDDGALARLLEREQPQLAAVVLAHMPPERAGKVLQRFPHALATDVLIRLGRLDETDPEVLRDIEHQLQAVLSPHLSSAQSKSQGAARVDAILQATAPDARRQWLQTLARRDAQLATAVRHDEPVSPPPVKVELRVATTADDPSALAPTPTPAPSLPFTALESLDDAGWQRLLLEAESEVVLLAFVGAEPKLIERILRGFSPAQRAHWRRQFAHPGPVRLRDIDAAQQRLTALAAELVEAGELHFGPRPRLAAA